MLLLVGSGDNGGDALYAGALLARRGVQVRALLLSPEKVHAGGLEALRAAGGRVVTSVADGGAPDVVVDGIVGIGGRGGLREDAAAVVAELGDVPFVAVDTPSGIDVDTGQLSGPHVRAAVTVTFGTHKVGHLVDPAAMACGAVHLVDIGLDLPAPVVTALQEEDVRALLPRPTPDAHKYTRGVVGVRAGSEQYPGAGVLCVSGAGAGLVGMVRYVGEAADLVRARHPEVVVGEGRVQAWVIGSGGGASAEQALADSLADEVPVVVDADGLGHVDGPLGVPALLTPHAGELARMLDVEREEVEAEQLRFAREAAERYDAVVLLKGRHTLVAAPDGRGATPPPSARRGWPPPAPATCSPASAAPCSPPGCHPSTPAPSAPGSTAPPPPSPATTAPSPPPTSPPPSPPSSAPCSLTVRAEALVLRS